MSKRRYFECLALRGGRRQFFGRTLQIFLLLVSLSAMTPSVFGQETNRAPVQNESTNSDETLQSYLQLQEQIHTLQLQLERTKQESDLAAAKNAELVSGRLQALEQSVVLQRTRDLEIIQGSNHTVLLVAVIFTGVGMLAMLFMALFQWRAVQRLGEISAAFPALRTVGPPPVVSVLGPGEAHLPAGSTAAQSSQRLLGAIDRLEQRLQDLEGAAQTSPAENHSIVSESELSSTQTNGKHQPDASDGAPESPQAERSRLLFAKAQSLFSLEQNEEALAAFDEVLIADPKHAEALVRKGAVLERLRRFDEAHECYDRAIAADGSLTIAYLYKGGLFNRQEQFTDALRCYEQALKARDKS